MDMEMHNSTEYQAHEDEEDFQNIHEQRLIAICLASILLTVSIYILISLIAYERKINMKNNTVRRAALSRQRGGVPPVFERNAIANSIRYLCLISAACTVARLCLECVELRYAFENNDVCNVLRHAKNVLYAACVTPLFAVLWLRQRVFYKSEVLKRLSSPPVKILSVAIMVIIVVGDVIANLLYLTTRKYKNSYKGCEILYDLLPYRLPGGFLFAITVTFQIILLALFIYPLLKSKKISLAVKGDTTKTMYLVKRATVMVVIVCLSHGLAGLLSMILSPYFISVFQQLLYDMSLIIGIFCVVGSFPDWKIRLLPHVNKQEAVVTSIRRKKNEHPTTSNDQTEFVSI